MVKEHIYRDFTPHRRNTYRPTHEYVGVEIYSYDHPLTKTYHLGNGAFLEKVNVTQTSRRHFQAFTSSSDKMYSFSFIYNCEKIGEHRIDIVYENKDSSDIIGRYAINQTKKASEDNVKELENILVSLKKQLESAKKKVTNQEKVLGKINSQSPSTKAGKAEQKKKKTVAVNTLAKLNAQVTTLKRNITATEDKISSTHILSGIDITFDGEKNIIKRKTLFVNFKETGNQKISLELPSNTYFMGAIIRKTKVFTADIIDNEFSLWNNETNLSLNECSITESSGSSPSEANITIHYSNSLNCPSSKTGLYLDYMDEVNIYYRVNDQLSGEVVQRFGGYISTVSLDGDRSKVTISCANRLIDGEHKYILDSLIILYGESSEEDMEYYNPINFENYGQALKYLCDIFEVTLDSNINKSYLVEGERYSTGLSMKFGKNKTIKSKHIVTSNASVSEYDTFVMVRNNKSSEKKQSILVYDGKKFSKSAPVDITNHLTFHMTYGLGTTKTTEKVSTTDTTTVGGDSSESYSKYGVSNDKTKIMAIGKASASGEASKYGNKFYKTIFKRKCPFCGSTELYWYIFWAGNEHSNGGKFPATGRWEGGSAEGHIFCKSCDADFSVIDGKDHSTPPRKTLTKIGKSTVSSKDEAYKLRNGKMKGASTTTSSGTKSVGRDEILTAIAKEAKKYSYARGQVGQTWSQMKKTGHGDCWGFSDLIFSMLKKYGVKCRIYQYATSMSSRHRVTAFLNEKNNWEVFPYKTYNVHPSMLNGSVKGSIYKSNNTGGNISQSKYKGDGSAAYDSTQTTEHTYTSGYDKDKPFQCYIKLVYSTSRSWKATTKNLYLKFTQSANSSATLSGLSTVWVNNSNRQTSVSMKNWFADNEPNKKIYLHQISFEAPAVPLEKNDDGSAKDTNWYVSDKTTHDDSSCKMDLYQIIFDDKPALNPTDLMACGKSINSVFESIIEQSDYRMVMQYNKHRCDDCVNFSIDNQKTPAFKATEGDNNNILEWSSINCTPVSDLRNKSICVYKGNDKKYAYVETGNVESILNYGEQTVLTTDSEAKGSKEAYFLARSNNEFNPNQHYSYTIVVPYAPKLHIGDLVEVVANAKQLNDIKTVESITVKYSPTEIPHVRTEIGLDELEPFLRLRKEQENLRKIAQEKTTYFSRTATPYNIDDVYIWED